MPKKILKAESIPKRILEAENIARVKRALEDILRSTSAPFAGLGHNRGPPLEAEPPVYDIPGFCAAHLISRTALYDLWRQGSGPKYYKSGKSVRITREAAAQWRHERENATNQQLKTLDVDAV